MSSKRILTIFIAVLICICSMTVPVTVNATTPSSDFSYTVESGAITITKYTGTRNKDYVIDIPSTINGVSVAKIGNTAFQDCYWITVVSIPSSVKSIGEMAFEGCRSLTAVNLEEGLWSIGPAAFYGCENLVNITLPNSLNSIDRGAFSDCTSLSSITIPRYVTSLNSRAFKGCTSLTSLTIHPDNASYTAIDNVIYTKDMWMLVSYPESKTDWQYTIPEGVVSLAEYSFAGCTELVDVVLPDSLKYIGAGAFSGCTNLVNPILPENLTSIGNRAFYGCSNIGRIEIPDSIETIDTEAFYNCNNLKKIFLPTHTIQLGDYPFPTVLDQQKYYRYKDTVTGVVVPADVKDATLTVTEITDTAVIAGYNENLTDEEVLKAYELTLTKNGEEADVWYPYVRIPTDVTDATVYVISEDGTLSKKDTEYKNGYAEIRVSELSAVILAGNVEFPTDEPTNPEESTAPEEPDTSVPDTSVDPTEPDTSLPDTTDTTESSTATDNSDTPEESTATDNSENPEESTAPDSDYSIGDVNLDNKVNVKDATLIQKHLASLVTLEGIVLDLADYDKDTKITIKDATAIQKFIAGIL